MVAGIALISAVLMKERRTEDYMMFAKSGRKGKRQMKINYKKPRFRDLKPEVQSKQITIATKELTELVIERMGNDLDAMLLFTLARDFGFRKHRLRKVYDGIFEAYRDLRNAWQGDNREVIDDAKRELKSIGVDVELWNEQKRAWLDGGYKKDECWNAHGRKEVEWK